MAEMLEWCKPIIVDRRVPKGAPGRANKQRMRPAELVLKEVHKTVFGNRLSGERVGLSGGGWRHEGLQIGKNPSLQLVQPTKAILQSTPRGCCTTTGRSGDTASRIPSAMETFCVFRVLLCNSLLRRGHICR